MMYPIRTPQSASTSRAPMLSASLITASDIPLPWNG